MCGAPDADGQARYAHPSSCISIVARPSMHRAGKNLHDPLIVPPKARIRTSPKPRTTSSCLYSPWDRTKHERRETANSELEAIAANPPSKQDVQLASYRLSTLGQASLGESTPEIRKSAEQTLIQLTQCVKPLLPQPPTTLFQPSKPA